MFAECNKYLTAHSYRPMLSTNTLPVHAEAELLVCIGYSRILKECDWAPYKYGAINVHTSLLPKYRGRHPVNWVLINDEAVTGVTVHYVDTSIDTGDIILQDSVTIDKNDDYNTLTDKLIECAKPLLLSAVQQIDTGCVYRRKQHMISATDTRRRYPGDSYFPLSLLTDNPRRAVKFINALVDPMPNAYTYIDGCRVSFKGARRDAV